MIWLPDMDLNHDKQIQSLLCYRYTIGQTGALEKLKGLMNQSSRQTAAGLKRQGEFKNHRKSRSRRGDEAEACPPDRQVVFAPKSASLRRRLPFLNSPCLKEECDMDACPGHAVPKGHDRTDSQIVNRKS